MFDRVLVAYEGSDRSEDALALGRLLAGPTGHVTAACSYWYEPLSARVGKGAVGPQAMRQGADETLEVLLRREGGDRLSVRSVPGPTPEAAIHELADDGEFDVVVIGSTRRGQVGRVLAGSTAKGLLHGAPCAVAVAPGGYRTTTPADPLRIGVAYVDTREARAALDVAEKLARDRRAQLFVLDAYDRVPVGVMVGPGMATMEALPEIFDIRAAGQLELDEALARCDGAMDVRGELLEGSPEEALIARAADLDLLVMGSRGYGRFRGVLAGSMSRRLADAAPCPLLLVPRTVG